MKIILCCATPGELKAAKTQIKSLDLKQSLDIHYLCTGIGNYATIFTLSNFLAQEKNPDLFLLNLGVCGYWNIGSPAPDLIQIGRIKNLHTSRELLPPLPFHFAPIESIWSGELVMTTAPSTDPSGYVDMESRGFEWVADQLRLPRLILKVPFDRIGEETESFDKALACNALAEKIDYQRLLERILKMNS